MTCQITLEPIQFFNNKTAQIWLSSCTVSGEMNSPSVFAELYYKNNLQSASHVSGRTTRL